MKKKTLIVYGGKSVEHDISIITAMQVAKQMPSECDVLLVYMDRNGLWWIGDNLSEIEIYSNFHKKAKNLKQISFILGEKALAVKKKNKFVPKYEIETIVNCCHGNIGEDGSVQGIFKSCNIPSTSSGVVSCAICMDKAFMKDILKANEISSPEYVYLNKCSYQQSKGKIIKNIESKISFPLIVKPANLGSSIGISVCHSDKEIRDAIDLAFEFDNKILIEKLVENLREFNCACLQFKGEYFLSSVNEVKNKKEIYSFEDKYLSKSGSGAEVEKKLSNKIKSLTEKVYKLFDCKGVVRIDFLYDEKQEILYVNEINSIPGSLAFYLFKDITFKDLLFSLIEQSKIDAEDQNNLIVNFDSDALKIFENVSSSFKK